MKSLYRLCRFFFPVDLQKSTIVGENLPKARAVSNQAFQPNHLSSLPLTRLVSRSGRPRILENDGIPFHKAVVGYAFGAEFDMDKLLQSLQEKRLYEPLDLGHELTNVIYARALYRQDDSPSRDVFFFREGAVVCWNMSASENKSLLQMLEFVEIRDDFKSCVDPERDYLDVNSSAKDFSAFSRDGVVYLGSTMDEIEQRFVKYAVSNALAQSVKLAVWEETLSKYVVSIQEISEDLRMGRNPKLSQKDVLIKSGEFYVLKHYINLESDLLDVPDFYWDRPELERIYRKAFIHLNIPKRTSVMNKRLDHCVELTQMMSTDLSHKHGSRLETIIICLIAIEVLFEVFHVVEKYYLE